MNANINKSKQMYKLRAGTPPRTTANMSVFFAVRIARKYARRTPTVKELMADYGMSRATAYRWVAAIKAA